MSQRQGHLLTPVTIRGYFTERQIGKKHFVQGPGLSAPRSVVWSLRGDLSSPSKRHAISFHTSYPSMSPANAMALARMAAGIGAWSPRSRRRTGLEER